MFEMNIERRTRRRSSVMNAFVNKSALALTTLLILGTIAIPAFGHHSFTAEFDVNMPVKLQGKVTLMKWANPHAWIYIDVVDPKGRVTNWALETGAANALIRRGWR